MSDTTFERLTFHDDHPEYGGIRRSPIPAIGVASMALEQLVVYENGPVFAIAGNAGDLTLQAQIQIAKGEARGDAPVGATMPFDDPLMEGVFRTDHMTDSKDRRLRKLLESPSELTAIFGGISFVRGWADLSKKNEDEKLGVRYIPDSIIPQPENGSENSTVQVYSPVGNVMTEEFIRSMLAIGAIPAMTSANPTGTPEIIYEDQAVEFALSANLPIVVRRPEHQKPEIPRSSYPISSIVYDEADKRWQLEIIRTGWVDPDVLVRLHDGLPINDDVKPVTKHPTKTLGWDHLPEQAQSARGADLRKWILEAAGLDR